MGVVLKGKAWIYAQAAKRVLGRDGTNWLKQNKAKVGTAVAFVAAGLTQIGYPEAAQLLGMVATLLLGGGLMKSDAEAKRQ